APAGRAAIGRRRPAVVDRDLCHFSKLSAYLSSSARWAPPLRSGRRRGSEPAPWPLSELARFGPISGEARWGSGGVAGEGQRPWGLPRCANAVGAAANQVSG